MSVYCTTQDSQILINVAIYDSVQRYFYVAKFFDNDHFSSLESFLIQIQPNDDGLKEFKLLIKVPELRTKKTKVIEILEALDVQHKVLSKMILKKSFLITMIPLYYDNFFHRCNFYFVVFYYKNVFRSNLLFTT